MKRRWSSIAVTLVILAGVTACSGARDADVGDQPRTMSSSPPNGPSSEPLTEGEYQAAFNTFKECTRNGGVDLVISGEENKVIQYAFRAEDQKVVDKCYSSGFEVVDIRWQQQQLTAG